MRNLRLAIGLAVFGATLVPALAVDYYVSTTGNDLLGDGTSGNPFATIQRGVDAASVGDQVLLQNGTYTGPGNIAVNMSGKNITVRSVSNNPATVVVDCQSITTGFQYLSGEGAASVLQGITVQNGLLLGVDDFLFPGDGRGGAVVIEGSGPTIRNCIFLNNAVRGGSSLGFALTPANGLGGAIYAVNASFTIEDCRFDGNDAFGGNGTSLFDIGLGSGGAVAGQFSNILFRRCVFVGNQSLGGTDGFNVQESNGGAVYIENGSGLFENCTFEGNEANRGGGALLNASGGNFTNCVFSLNNARAGNGGGVYASGAPWTLINCSLSGNTASAQGGGIYVDPAAVGEIANTILWGNSAPSGAEVSANGSVVVASYSIIAGSGGSSSWSLALVTDGGSNLAANPQFIRNPGTSGPTDGGDLRLQGGSPGIDSGSNAKVPPGVTTDRDGNARIVNGTVDRGAYELSLTVVDRINILKASVSALTISPTLKSVLQFELDRAIVNYNAGRESAAILNMQTFIFTVNVYQLFGVITPSQGNNLRSQAQTIIAQIQA